MPVVMAEDEIEVPIVRRLTKRPLRVVRSRFIVKTKARVIFIPIVALLSIACEKEEGPPLFRPRERDAGATSDRNRFQQVDPHSDAGVEPDADDSSIDETIPTEDAFSVEVSNDDLFTDARGYCLSVEANTFAFAYQNHTPSVDCRTRIDFILIPSSGPIPAPETVVNKDFNCSLPREPTLVFNQESWHMAWTDTRSFEPDTPDYEPNIYSMALDTDQQKSPITLDALAEQNAALTVVDSKILLAWISERTTESDEKKRSIKTRLLGAPDSEEIVVVPEDDNRMPEGLVVAPIGRSDAVLGWVDRSDTTCGVFVLPLDSEGAAKEDPGHLTSFSATSIDIATGDTGNAAVYSLNVGGGRQVRFQILDGSGGRASVKDERRLIASPEQGMDASVVYWGAHGFVVSYRGYNSNDTSSATIRILVIDLGIDWNPSNLQPQDVASATLGGGRTTVRLANDGTLAVAWLDAQSADNKSLNLVRLR